MISFDCTADEYAAIGRIADRALHMFGDDRDKQEWMMDVEAVHANGCSLDLAKLESFDDFNFAHDMGGIARHLDRDDDSPTGGQLLNFFYPRCAAKYSTTTPTKGDAMKHD